MWRGWITRSRPSDPCCGLSHAHWPAPSQPTGPRVDPWTDTRASGRPGCRSVALPELLSQPLIETRGSPLSSSRQHHQHPSARGLQSLLPGCPARRERSCFSERAARPPGCPSAARSAPADAWCSTGRRPAAMIEAAPLSGPSATCVISDDLEVVLKRLMDSRSTGAVVN